MLEDFMSITMDSVNFSVLSLSFFCHWSCKLFFEVDGGDSTTGCTYNEIITLIIISKYRLNHFCSVCAA